MIEFYTPNGDRYSCVRHNYNHKVIGLNTPCLACRREHAEHDLTRAVDEIRRATSEPQDRRDALDHS